MGALVCLALVALLLGASACSRGADADEDKEPLKTVRVKTIGRADIAEVLTYSADLEAIAQVRLFSPVPDRILSFPWKDGDEIKKGQRVALVRTDGLNQGLAQFAAQVDALDVQISNFEVELGRLEPLLASGAIPKAEVDRAQTALDAARSQRQALQAGQGQLAVTVGDASVRAPIAGVIADKMFDEGDMVAPTIPLCRIMNIDQLEASLRLVESDVPKVRVGQEVILHLDAFPGRTFQGKVTTVLPYLDRQTRTNTVEVTVDNPKSESGQRPLKPGMFGRAELVVERRGNVVVAPEPALLLDNRVLDQEKPGEHLRKAFVVDGDGIAHEHIVKLGARKGALLEVLEGLEEGDRIVIRGQHGLVDGQHVEIVEASKEK